MKTYQKPELVMQNIDVADVLTVSAIIYCDDVDVKGDAVVIDWSQI